MYSNARDSSDKKDEWRREAPPLIFGVLCPKQNLHCYRCFFETVALQQSQLGSVVQCAALSS